MLTGTYTANSVITSILCVSKLKLLTTDLLFQKHHHQKINGAVLTIFLGNPFHRHFLLILLKMFWLMILIRFSLKKFKPFELALQRTQWNFLITSAMFGLISQELLSQIFSQSPRKKLQRQSSPVPAHPAISTLFLLGLSSPVCHLFSQ